MKIDIGPYRDWLGPYQLAEKICFWTKGKDEYGLDKYPDWVHDFGDILSHGSVQPEDDDFIFARDDEHYTWIHKLLLWIDSKKHRKIKVRIDCYDTWGMDSTLAHIIVPMLKQLRDTTHGYPSNFIVDESDWSQQKSFEGEGFEFPEDYGFEKWKETLNEMIWAFEQLLDDNWEDQYYTGKADFRFKKIEGTENSEMIDGPNHTLVCDRVGMKAHQDRMQKGYELFGKYYRSLWD